MGTLSMVVDWLDGGLALLIMMMCESESGGNLKSYHHAGGPYKCHVCHIVCVFSLGV